MIDPVRRGSKSKPRSRAASVTSSQPTEAAPPFAKPAVSTQKIEPSKGYSGSALAVGRSLLSGVSSTTIRAPKTSTGSLSRSSFVNRAQASRPFPIASSPPPSAESLKHTSDASNSEPLPPPSVELSSIVPDEARPPTVLLSRQNLGSFFMSSKVGRGRLSTASRFKNNGDEPPLTDRYGFICERCVLVFVAITDSR